MFLFIPVGQEQALRPLVAMVHVTFSFHRRIMAKEEIGYFYKRSSRQ